jgi:hypothetical protein
MPRDGFFAKLKMKRAVSFRYKTRQEAREDLMDEFKRFDNIMRGYSTLNGWSPVAFKIRNADLRVRP